MALTMTLTDGTTTINIGASYDIKLKNPGWEPAVARRRKDILAGRLPYYDVDENPIELVITGSDTDDLLANYQELAELMDQAESWGPPFSGYVDVVLFKYRKDGSTLTNPVYSPIWGQPSGRPILTARSDFSDNTIIHATLNFRRLGLFLNDTETETSSTSTGNPAKVTSSTFTDTAKILWPYDAYIQFSDIPSLPGEGIFMAFANDTNKLLLWEAEDRFLGTMTAPGSITGASAGDVARTDTSSGTSFNILDNLDDDSFETSIGLIHVFAMVRNNSSTISYTMRGWVGTTTPEMEQGTGPTRYIDTSSQSPQLIDLGEIAYKPLPSSAGNYLIISIESSSAPTVAGDTLDVDYIVIIGVDDSTRIVYMDTENENYYWMVEHQLEDNPDPRAYVALTAFGTDTGVTNHDGDILLAATGNAISCIVFGPKDGDFTIQNSSNTELNVTLGVKRTNSYLTPI